MSISDIINQRRADKLNNRHHELGISSTMFNKRTDDYGIYNIYELIKSGRSKDEITEILKNQMIYNLDYSDFYDFSLLVGFNFGVYNCYCYIPISKTMKERILDTNPNEKDTKIIFDLYRNDIYKYLENKYGFNSDDSNLVINKMLSINEDDSLYNNDVSRDIAKIIIGTKLQFDIYTIKSNSNEVRQSILTGNSVLYFDNLNDLYNEINHKNN